MNPTGVLHAPSALPGEAGYTALVRADGTGLAICAGLAVTAWSGRRSGLPEGLLFYVRDLDTGRFWRVGDPGPEGRCEARRRPGLFTLIHEEDGLRATLEICRAPQGTAEWRRVTLEGLADGARRLDVTSVAEIVLNQPAAHAAHPVFSKLFLQTRRDEATGALLVGRRARDPHESHPWVVHAMPGGVPDGWETDRARFFGRGRPPRRPAALACAEPLSGTTGNVLDPVVSLRRQVNLLSGNKITVNFLLGLAPDPEAAQALAVIPGPPADLAAWAQGDPAAPGGGDDRTRAENLAGAILSGAGILRAAPEVLNRAAGDLAALARCGVEPGLALVLVPVQDENAPQLARIRAMAAIWRSLDLPLRAVALGEAELPAAADDPLIRLRTGDLTGQELDLLAARAAWVVTGDLSEVGLKVAAVRSGVTPAPAAAPARPAEAPPQAKLLFDNGFGGFSADGREYVMRLQAGCDGVLPVPPRPWTNVLANESLGCIVSETGAACTWAGNSRENRLTPWSNDPLLDPHTEALYLRDEDTGEAFSLWPGPRPGTGAYEVAHGFGYSRCRRWGDGLETTVTVFVGPDDPVRLTRVRVANRGGTPRRLSLWSFQQLVLGGTPAESAPFVVTATDPASGALLARNNLAGPFAGRTAFAAVVRGDHLTGLHHSGDAAAFLGPAADPAAPAALAAPTLDGRTGPGLDPCFAHQALLTVPAAATAEVVFLLGQAADAAAVNRLLARLASPAAVEEAWRGLDLFWRRWHDTLQVETPSPALDLMVNGWLGYQTLACRLWGRSALYQSGGAFGFRDQLQDSLALLAYRPDLTRRQILLHAGHQFVEGDVLHWWHPPLDRGIRTRFADDYLWLPFAVLEYLNATDDQGLLDEAAPYLQAPLLAEGQDEVFLQARPSGTSGTVYEHCCRALDRALVCGEHGLPLFGTGDWNDGMNRVGREGRGESVWMGFFLITIIDGFLAVCEGRGDQARAHRYAAHRDDLIKAVNETGWDGGWYRRGYYDDGTALGSWENKECAIDALAQAWSVLSGAAPARRAAQVMDAVEEHLINDDEGLIRLLTPPFVDTPHDPGYIKGYVAGVRENGGQYTHAATWVVRAMAALGRRNRAAELLDLLNPVLHAATPEQVARYQVEPYVVAADIYGAAPHVGRGGWTWYTGSSAWLLRTALESVLGLLVEGSQIILAPCVPDSWPGYRLTWRVPGDCGTRYEVQVDNPDGWSEAVVQVTLDGAPLAPVAGRAQLPLVRDGGVHRIILTLGRLRKGDR